MWYKDAIIYEVNVRAFHDGSGAGMGDFRGLTRKLDYLQDLGITAIWLLPFYPSRGGRADVVVHQDIHETATQEGCHRPEEAPSRIPEVRRTLINTASVSATASARSWPRVGLRVVQVEK
jgi:hypothetical protein